MVEGRMLGEAPFTREQVEAFAKVLAYLEVRLESYKLEKTAWK
jgi:hypothetical protein